MIAPVSGPEQYWRRSESYTRLVLMFCDLLNNDRDNPKVDALWRYTGREETALYEYALGDGAEYSEVVNNEMVRRERAVRHYFNMRHDSIFRDHMYPYYKTLVTELRRIRKVATINNFLAEVDAVRES